MKYLIGVFLALGLLPGFTSQAEDRIRAMHFDKSRVEKVYVSPGLATLMIFPCEINEAIVGQEQGLKAVVSPTSKKQVTLFCSSSASLTTNLIVRCGGKTDPFVFDVVVSHVHHQDVLKVTGSFSGPVVNDDAGMTLVDSSSMQPQKKKKFVIEVSPPVLIEESK